MALHELSLVAMVAAIDAGLCTAQDIWADCAAQIARCEPQVQAWAHSPRSEFPPTASPQSQAEPGALRGLPFGVKDTMDVRGLPCERGSPIWQGRVADADATVVSLLQTAGARVMGKTVSTEFAFFRPGVTANPHHLAHTPGGSSSGSAAAVAACMVPFALGSQTAASVIRPASFCGVVGYVASMGMVALRGVTPLAQSLDALGLFAREVADLQLLHSSLHRNAAVPQAAPACLPRRLLLMDGSLFGAVEPCMSDTLHANAELLRTLGIDVRSAKGVLTDALLQEATRVHFRLMAREAYENLAFESSHHRDLLSPQIRELLDTGGAVSGAEHAALLKTRMVIARQLDDALVGWDAVLAPAANGGAPKGLGATGRPDQSRAWQLLGLPQISLPVATDAQGLPLGLQLIGRYGQDAALLTTARVLQERMGWRAVPPTMAELSRKVS